MGVIFLKSLQVGAKDSGELTETGNGERKVCQEVLNAVSVKITALNESPCFCVALLKPYSAVIGEQQFFAHLKKIICLNKDILIQFQVTF